MKPVPAIHVATLVAVSSVALGAQSLQPRVAASTRNLLPNWRAAAAPAKDVTFVTYHKTGTVLVSDVLRKCFPTENYSLVGHGEEPWEEVTYVVHHVRSPMSMLKSGYFYHLTATESWLHDRGRHRMWIHQDAKCFAEFKENETYQEYLNRVPPTLGIRAELHRSHKPVSMMLANSWKCRSSEKFCKQVCLEDFTASSQLFNQTWSGILDFLSFGEHQVARHLQCISLFDLLSPNYNGAGDNHTTNDKAAVEREMIDLTDVFTKLDEELYNGTFAAASRTLCPATQLEYMSEHPFVDHYDEIAEMYG